VPEVPEGSAVAMSHVKMDRTRSRRGPLVDLEGLPPFFDQPATRAEMREVVRILRTLPPEADVEYRDITDVYEPYLSGRRFERLATLLTALDRRDEAREALWHLYERTPVRLEGRALTYPGATAAALALLLDGPLWDERDVERRLAQTSKYLVEGRVTTLLEFRKVLARGRLDEALDRVLKLRADFNMHVNDVDRDFYRDVGAIVVKLFLCQPGVYPVVLDRYRTELPAAIYSDRVAPLAWLLRALGNPDALHDLVEGLYHPVSDNNSLARFVLHRAIAALGGKLALARLAAVHDASDVNYLRPLHTESFNPVAMNVGRRYESLAEVGPKGFAWLPDPAKSYHEIAVANPSKLDAGRRGKLIVRFTVLSARDFRVGSQQWLHEDVSLGEVLWLDDLGTTR
jgi:hypothetical protein